MLKQFHREAEHDGHFHHTPEEQRAGRRVGFSAKSFQTFGSWVESPKIRSFGRTSNWNEMNECIHKMNRLIFKNVLLKLIKNREEVFFTTFPEHHVFYHKAPFMDSK